MGAYAMTGFEPATSLMPPSTRLRYVRKRRTTGFEPVTFG